MLLLDVRVSYLNETRNLLPVVLSHACQTTVFGPGYVSPAVLSDGADQFTADHGPFDLILATEHIWNPPTRDSPTAFRNYQFTYSSAPSEVELSFCARVSDWLSGVSQMKGALVFETDHYSVSPETTQRLQDFDFVMGPVAGAQFVPDLARLPKLADEHFGRNATNTWLDFLTSTSAKLIAIPHFVGSNEFEWTVAHGRPYPLAIPGVAYSRRRCARASARKAGLQLAPPSTGSARRTASAAVRRLPQRLRRYDQAFRRESFRQEISLSMACYTDGSALDFPVRKFFEIPALGSALLATPCSGFSDLGFEAGHNCFALEPEAVGDVTQDLVADPDRVNEITERGRELILSRHSTHARARQISDAFAALLDGSLVSAEWVEGHFRISGRE